MGPGQQAGGLGWGGGVQQPTAVVLLNAFKLYSKHLCFCSHMWDALTLVREASLSSG